jgi:cation:H+ antiporter
MTIYILLVSGLILLIVGGELLVRGASTLAQRLGMSPLLIGLTLVGFGTSTPELVTSVEASLRGSPGIAIGNIVGSNIANILLILGVAALLAPIAVSRQALARDGGIVLASAILFIVIGHLMPLDRLVGAMLIAGLALYLYVAYRQEMAAPPAGHMAPHDKFAAHDEVLPGALKGGERSGSVWSPLMLAIAGLAVVVLGGKLLVDGAVGFARAAGVSETVIGLTIVAIGTSLPELVTSIIAALRRHGDVALGNILGSNIYNILGIGGATALIAPTVVPPEILRFDGLVMIAVSLMLLVIALTGFRISRAEGAVLLACYALYIHAIWPV